MYSIHCVQKKTHFLIITPAFLGQFYTFYTNGIRNGVTKGGQNMHIAVDNSLLIDFSA